MTLGPIGLGTFPFSNVFGPVSASEAETIVHAFLDGEGTYIQTSPYYEGVDALMGQILSTLDRNSFRIGTLCVKDRQSNLAGSYKAVIAQCEDSLSHLNLDHIDVYMTSTPEATDAPFSETIGAMEDLRSQGKIVDIGVCNVTLTQLEDYNSGSSVQFVQNRLSLIDQVSDIDVRRYCVDNDIRMIPYNVIEWGLLTSKILGPLSLREGDLRSRVLPVFSDEPVERIREWVLEYLVPVADGHSTTIEALAVAWAASQPGVEVCPVGATSRAQIFSTLKARDLVGNSEILGKLDAAYTALELQIESTYSLTVNEFLRNSYGRW